MKKNILVIILLSFTTYVMAQKSQRIGYIDMEYILKNIPQYLQAQNSLNSKVGKWKAELNKEDREIEVMKTDLANEKAILTKELIAEREDDINAKEKLLSTKKNSYFGPDGEMFTLRKQLIKPVQDQVYNSVQTIAKRKKLDFVFDKSSDLVMLYANKKNNISELVMKLIKVDQKRQTRAEKVEERKRLLKEGTMTEAQKEKSAKKAQAARKRTEAKEARKKQTTEQRKAQLKKRAEKRAALIKKRDSIRKVRLEMKNK